MFNNGNGQSDRSYSSVDELALPLDGEGRHARDPSGRPDPAKLVWSYTAPKKSDFYSFFISGAASDSAPGPAELHAESHADPGGSFGCRSGGLLAALSEDHADRELLTAAGEIIQALIAGGPTEEIEDDEDARPVIESYLGHPPGKMVDSRLKATYGLSRASAALHAGLITLVGR